MGKRAQEQILTGQNPKLIRGVLTLILSGRGSCVRLGTGETKSYELLALKRTKLPDGRRMAIRLLGDLFKVEVGCRPKRTSLGGREIW